MSGGFDIAIFQRPPQRHPGGLRPDFEKKSQVDPNVKSVQFRKAIKESMRVDSFYV